MSLLVYAMFLITPATVALVALVSLRKSRLTAMAGGARVPYLRRVFLLVVWGAALAIGWAKLGNDPGAAGFCQIVFGPGVSLVFIRLLLEIKHMRRMVNRPAGGSEPG